MWIQDRCNLFLKDASQSRWRPRGVQTRMCPLAKVAVVHVFIPLVLFNESVNEAIISLAAGLSFTEQLDMIYTNSSEKNYSNDRRK